MDKRVFQQHAEVCQALANPVRLEILDLLRGGEKRVTDLAEQAGLNPVKISQHLRLMRQRGVVATRREGRNIYYHIVNRKFVHAYNLIHLALVEQAAAHAKLMGSRRSSRKVR